MTSPAAPRRYTVVAILLHWLIAFGILALIAMGLVMAHADIAPMQRFQLYQWHKSVGLTVLMLALLRLLWRVFHRPPPLPAAMPAAERRAASAAHLVLYGLMLGLPLVGWALVSASPFNIPTVLYGVLPWPHLPGFADLSDKAAVEGVLKLVHAYGAWFLGALVVLHVGAALRHHLVLRDDTLWRMLPFVRRPQPSPLPQPSGSAR
ncbi:MAG: cytochrome b [Methylobacterium frigidaeris]